MRRLPRASAPKRMVFPRHLHSSIRVSIALIRAAVRSAGVSGTATPAGARQATCHRRPQKRRSIVASAIHCAAVVFLRR
jgi:hypothetical protein